MIEDKSHSGPYDGLTPDKMLNAVEEAIREPLTAYNHPFPSYINRVYELQTKDGSRIVAKFYRPDRWTRDAIGQEHRFVLECAEADIPVVAPLHLSTGETLADCEDIPFAVFPKKGGRQFEVNTDADWQRLGSLIARIHLVGERHTADTRVTIDPRVSTQADLAYLLEHVIPPHFAERYESSARRVIEIAGPLFAEERVIRVHGDCHQGNILDRLDEGLMVIDFDDMAMGPAMQDLWLLLPEHANKAQREIDLLLAGYERLRKIDRASIKLIEPLRAMRMIYFLAWVSRQRNDHQFQRNFPDWGSDRFWEQEIRDLREQLAVIYEHLEY